MGGTAGTCRYAAPASHEPHFGQVGEDDSEVSGSKESCDVLQEQVFWSYCANDGFGCWPHVALVRFGKLLARNAEWLAGKACANHVRNASVLVGCTGLNELTHVSEDRGFVQVSVCDSRGNDSLAILVPLDVSDMLPSH